MSSGYPTWRACCITGAILGFGFGLLNGFAQEQSTLSSGNRPPSDAYLLAVVATGHVVVLHDHIGLLMELGSQPERKPAIVRRLTELLAHCARLEKEFDRRSGRNSPPDDLSELFRLLAVECDAARSALEEPTGSGQERFKTSRTALTAKLKDIGERKSP